jgi:hypothetical protein
MEYPKTAVNAGVFELSTTTKNLKSINVYLILTLLNYANWGLKLAQTTSERSHVGRNSSESGDSTSDRLLRRNVAFNLDAG